MAFIGKLLVIVHGALAIAVLAWAGGVYTQRIHWNTPPNAKDTPGLFDRQKAKADEYNGAADRAYTRWSANLSQVQVLEAERYPRRAYYKTQLELVKTGKQPNAMGQLVDVPDPVKELVYAPNGYLDINPNAARKAFEVRPGVKAASIVKYDKMMERLLADIAASQVRNKEAIDERKKLNDEIVGVTDPTPKKGLRTLLAEQKTIEDQANAEEAYATGFVTNREAEFGLLKKRRDAMQARMNELKDYESKEKKKNP